MPTESTNPAPHIVLLSVYHQIEAFCPSDDSSKKFRTFLSSIEWKLPKVTFDWRARCVRVCGSCATQSNTHAIVVCLCAVRHPLPTF